MRAAGFRRSLLARLVMIREFAAAGGGLAVASSRRWWPYCPTGSAASERSLALAGRHAHHRLDRRLLAGLAAVRAALAPTCCPALPRRVKPFDMTTKQSHR